MYPQIMCTDPVLITTESLTIKIKYFGNVDRISVIPNGDWIDLRSRHNIMMRQGEYRMIPLGVAMELPEGYEAHVVPRSSTFKRYGIIMTNSIGIIDHTYCGENDEWQFPALAMRDTTINVNDRICQFRIVKSQFKDTALAFETVTHLGNADRGGFGSTGK